MRNLRNTLLTIFLAGGIFAQAQEPAPLLVKTPTDRMEWSMTIKPYQKAKEEPTSSVDQNGNPLAPVPAPALPTSVDFTRANGMTKIVISYSSGPKREVWSVGNGILSQTSSKKIRLLSNDFPRYPYAAKGFYGIENVNPAHDQGEVLWEKIRCRYFKGTRTASFSERPSVAGPSSPLPKSQVEYEAWFDVATGLPRAYRADGKTFLFAFSPNPPADLTLPSEWKVALEKDLRNFRRAGLVP